MEVLAIRGGGATAEIEWPIWPRSSSETLKAVAGVLESGRWALSGQWRGSTSREQEFARRFAEYNEVAHCVPTANGTSALTIAFEGLGVGAGDEVLVPGLTWVASASSVLNVNAVPVLVDVDPATLCASAEAIEAAITSRTTAISVVHLYSAVTDMDAVLEVADRHGLPVVEDCAQAHGARWRGRRVGSLGRVGAFSMQQTKLLAAGEGGAATTDDPELADRLFQLRADGRSLADGPRVFDQVELSDRSSVMGSNYCMPESSAAILLAQLTTLEQENEVRDVNAVRLADALERVPGVMPIRPPSAVTDRAYYQFAVSIDRDAFAGRPLEQIRRALEAELDFPVSRSYPPLNDNPLYQPHNKRRYRLSEEHARQIDPRRFDLPEAERAFARVLILHHRVLLAGAEAMTVVSEAFSRVQRLADQIPG